MLEDSYTLHVVGILPFLFFKQNLRASLGTPLGYTLISTFNWLRNMRRKLLVNSVFNYKFMVV